MTRKACLLAAGAIPAFLLVSACGGGGGGVNSTPPPPTAPAPTPPPPPAPPPPPPPPPPTNFDTAEFDVSSGIAHANAVTAYEQGATGEGVLVGVVDSGIDVDSPEFAGRISSASRDFGGDRGIDDIGGHGTSISGVIAAARNDRSIVGIAFDSTILTLRTDEPGSCNTDGEDGGCTHPTDNMARAINHAVASGARVINISLGGSTPPSHLRNAIANAASAGVVIVISAGNEGGAQPDPLAYFATAPEADGHVIVAGAVDSADQLAEFSNQAGDAQAFFLSALGVRVRSFDHRGDEFLYSGTSYSTPLIAGAVALLADAFPNLTGREIIDILYRSARDAGAPGDDPVYGQGILDLASAFQPIGEMSLAGSAEPVTAASSGTLSAPMGDARPRHAGAIVLDGFDRAFVLDLAASLRRMPAQNGLATALGGDSHSGFAAAPAPGTLVAVDIRESREGALLRQFSLRPEEASRTRAVAGMIAARIDSDTHVAFGFSRSGEAVGVRLNGRVRPAFLVARSGDEPGFARQPEMSFALHRRLGDTGVTAFGEKGDALSRRDPDRELTIGGWQRADYRLAGVSFDRQFGPVRVDAGVTYLAEEQTLLGARFGPGLGGPRGANTLFADLGLGYAAGNGWSLAADLRHGWTRGRGSDALFRGARLRTLAWSADLSKAGVIDETDRLSLRIAQPLRVYDGGLDLTLPTAYSYASESASYEDRTFGLAPRGREIDVEAAYARPLGDGWLTGHLFYRTDPGHVSAMPDDVGAAIRFTLGF